LTSFGYSSGSKYNYLQINSGVELIEFTDSDSNSLNYQEVGTYNLENSKRISVYQSSYDYVICDSDSSLYLKNWININVSREDSPLSNVDIKIWDGDNIMYSTDYFGGANSKTDSQGKAPQDIEVIYRVFNGSSTATDNVTKVKLRVGDWFKTKTSETDETRVDIDFEVPVFRITNQDAAVEYNYIQRAIDNVSVEEVCASKICTIFLSSGEYNEPIDITDEIILKGNGTSTIINGDGGTAIEVSEDSVTIKNLKIINAEKGIYVNGTEDTVITNIKFVGSDYGVYSEDSQNLIVNNAIFDVDDYGIHLEGSSSVSVMNNEFRNGTESGDYCLYQSESSNNSEANIENNKFNDCNVAWRSGSSDNTFRNNTLKDNEYGVLLSGTESYQNLLLNNTFDDSGIAVYIYNTAYNNSLFNNEFDNSDDYDIKLSDSYDTVSYNNLFSDILVEEDANMWVKVDINLIVYDNSSATFLDADVEVKQDNLVVYSSSYFGGSDSKTDSNGTIETFLINYKEYNGSSTPTIIPTYVTIRNYDW
jgi:parallel beta-helix repeat protein